MQAVHVIVWMFTKTEVLSQGVISGLGILVKSPLTVKDK